MAKALKVLEVLGILGVLGALGALGQGSWGSWDSWQRLLGFLGFVAKAREVLKEGKIMSQEADLIQRSDMLKMIAILQSAESDIRCPAHLSLYWMRFSYYGKEYL